MRNLGLKKEFINCFPILESTKKSYIKKVCEVNKFKNSIIELRIDYLLSVGLSIEQIIEFIAFLKKKYTRKKLIATIRSYDEGGKVDLDGVKYFHFIKMLYLKSNVNAIDVEYKFYKPNKELYDDLFKLKKKDVILSIHIFDRVLLKKEYKRLFNDMADSKATIIKFAIKTYTKEDLFTFMNVARKSHKVFTRKRKKVVFIALGELGKISRVFPEYTYTSIVFQSAYINGDKNLGQINHKEYNKYRKLLAKTLEN